jgi:cobalt-zinc-cadmium efflux system outer membrane protein
MVTTVTEPPTRGRREVEGGITMVTERVAICVALLASGCIAHGIREDVADVRSTLADRAALDVREPERAGWDEQPPEVEEIVARPLTVDDAVRVALLNNRELRASLFDMGIARGALVQAGQVSNPSIHGELRVPLDGDEPLQADFGVAFDLTDIILAPVRQEAARSRLVAQRYRTAGAVLDLAYRVRLAFVRYQASAQSLELVRTALESFEASAAAARALFAAGNVREVDLALEEAAYEEARIAVARAELAVQDDRERVNMLLGLYGRGVQWEAADRLADPDRATTGIEHVERRAIEASLELAWTRAEIEATGRSLGAARAEGLVPEIELGVHAEHDGTRWEIGPEITIGVPIFSQNQGTVIAREAELDAMRERYAGLAVDIRAAARAARNRAVTSELLARRVHEVLLPARARVFEQTLLLYNAMQIDVFRLLQARREQIDAAQQYIDALREYWEARATLDQILAGRLAGPIGSADRPAFRAGSMPSGEAH